MNERRSRNLDTLLAAAAAPPLAEEHDERVLANVLAEFNAASAAARAGVAVTEPITALSPIEPVPARDSRPRRRSVRLALQTAAVAAIVAGAGIAAGSAGILPSPVQAFVHQVFGGIGVPGPTPDSTPGGRLSASASPSTNLGIGPDWSASPSASGLSSTGGATGAPATSSASDATEASLVTLCGEVQSSGNGWKTTMSAQDQARLVAAAGGVNKVHAYCAHLLHSSGGATATPTAGSTATPTPAPSATKKNGKGKDKGDSATVPFASASASASTNASTKQP